MASSDASELTGAVTTIAGLTERALAHRSLELALFELVGAWITSGGSGLVRAHAAAWSQHHAWHAELWDARLPRTPLLGERSEQLDQNWIDELGPLLDHPNTEGGRISVYADGILAGLEELLEAHRMVIDPGLDAPTARVLDLVLADVRRDRATATALAHTLGPVGDDASAAARVCVVARFT